MASEEQRAQEGKAPCREVGGARKDVCRGWCESRQAWAMEGRVSWPGRGLNQSRRLQKVRGGR